jgi:hypothetical protein
MSKFINIVCYEITDVLADIYIFGPKLTNIAKSGLIYVFKQQTVNLRKNNLFGSVECTGERNIISARSFLSFR